MRTITPWWVDKRTPKFWLLGRKELHGHESPSTAQGTDQSTGYVKKHEITGQVLGEELSLPESAGNHGYVVHTVTGASS